MAYPWEGEVFEKDETYNGDFRKQQLKLMLGEAGLRCKT